MYVLRFLFLIFHFSVAISLKFYPSLQWTPLNPIFQTNYSIAVLPMSKIQIVCPNPAMIPIPVQGSTPKEELYENLWMVDKQAYDACSIDTSKYQNRLLMRCDTPLQLRYFTIVFQRFSAIGPDGLEFEPGKDYYLIATSSGREPSLHQTSGGRCSTHNMRIKIYVCMSGNDPKCNISTVSVAVQPTTTTVIVCSTPTQVIHVSSTAVTQHPYCPADKHQVSEMLNNTRFIPEILYYTSQLTTLWAQLENMNNKLDAIQDKLDNCSFGTANGHMTFPPPTLTPSPTPTRTQAPTQPPTQAPTKPPTQAPAKPPTQALTKPPTQTPTTPPVLADCIEMYNAGFQASGVYLIRPKAGKQSFPVYCDQNTAVGGWIVIQKRFDGSVRFSDRKWVEYESGFGDLTGEFWLGLDKIHLLTKTPVRIRFDLGAPDGTNKFAAYQGFTIAGADQKYKLTTGTYIAGTCGDSFTFEDGNQFSTVDQDNDGWKKSCAKAFQSGWWHGRCHKSSLNGLYLNETDKDPNHLAAGITWHSWKGYEHSLSESEMKIRLWS